MSVLVVLACLLASAFFSAAEIAFLSANRVRLRHLAEQGSRVARGYMDAFQHPEISLAVDENAQAVGDGGPPGIVAGLDDLGLRPIVCVGQRKDFVSHGLPPCLVRSLSCPEIRGSRFGSLAA